MKGAKVDAVDKLGRTPLYFAAQSDNYRAVVTLVEEGGADIFKTDFNERKGPYDVAKSTDILKYFFSKTTVEKLLEEDPEIKLFDKIVENNPSLIGPFLDIFISPCGKADLDSLDARFEYNLSLFNTGNQEKKKMSNMMHRHLKLIDTKNTDMLLHPIMRAFTNLKWMQSMGLFLLLITCVFAFLLCFSYYGYHYIEVIKCQPLNFDKAEKTAEKKEIEENCARGFEGIWICTNEGNRTQLIHKTVKTGEIESSETHQCKDLKCK